VNLVASDPVKAALIAAFIHFNGISARDVAGTIPGSVYYAYLPSTHAYWALARFKPSLSASLQVQVGFQDNGNFAILAQPAGANWSVVNVVGEPPCRVDAGLPVALERLWNLSDSPGCGPMSSPAKLVNAVPYHASFEVPARWTATPHQSGTFDQDGSSGYVEVNAASGANTIRATCQSIANDNVRHPYGTAPTVSIAMIDKHQGCFITPSADAFQYSSGPGGYVDSSLVVRYRIPLRKRYDYLLITCDPEHLWSIAQSIQLAPGY
jgi:hypothetical protein